MARTVVESLTCDRCGEAIADGAAVSVKVLPDSPEQKRVRMDLHEQCYLDMVGNAAEMKRGRKPGQKNADGTADGESTNGSGSKKASKKETADLTL